MSNRSHEEQKLIYKPSNYSKNLKRYLKKHCSSIDTMARSISYTNHLSVKYPVFKLLKAVARLFIVNEFQMLFWATVLKSTNWNINHPVIIDHRFLVHDLVCCPNDDGQYRQLILYLMLVSFGVKVALNGEVGQLADEGGKVCVNFINIFLKWMKDNNKHLRVVNLKTLNLVYSQIYAHKRFLPDDLDIAVDLILQLSHAYSGSDKNQQKRQNNAKQIQEAEAVRKNTKDNMHGLKMLAEEINPSFELNQLSMLHIEDRCSEIDQSNAPMFNPQSQSIFPKFKSAFGSSIGGMQFMASLKYSVKQDIQCQQFEVGLGDGESNDLMIFERTDSLIGINKGISVTEKYLALRQTSIYGSEKLFETEKKSIQKQY